MEPGPVLPIVHQHQQDSVRGIQDCLAARVGMLAVGVLVGTNNANQSQKDFLMDTCSTLERSR
jgi:hypothetical protein